MEELTINVIGFYNRMTRNMEVNHPLAYNLRKKLTSNKRYGFQLLDEEGKVIEEYTFKLATKPYIISCEEGINNVSFTKGVKVSALEKLLENEQDYIDKPFRTILKNFKYIFDGSVTFRKKKKT